MPCGAGSDAESLVPISLQRAAETAASIAGDNTLRATVDAAVASGGQPLQRGVRGQMEEAFGASFSDVRIHTGSAASTSARALQASAYTQGRDIVFDEGNYAPGTDSGRRLLAHELTHVVQQRAGRVAATDAGGGVAVSDPNDRFERAAEETAGEVSARISAGAAASPHTLLALQQTAGNAAVAKWRSAMPAGAASIQRCGGHACEAGGCTCSHEEHEEAGEVTPARPVSRSVVGAPVIQRAPCPRAPTRLGDVPLDFSNDCAAPMTSVGGERIPFCNDSDVMTDAGEMRLAALVPLLMTMPSVELHGYASPEGPAGRETDYNMNLSCRRARAVAATLIASGVLPARISVFKHGGGTEFGASRPANRVVVIPLTEGPVTPGPRRTHFRVASVSYLACAGCNPFTDDGALATSPPTTEPAIGSGYRMKHWIDAEITSRDTIHVDSGSVRGGAGYSVGTSGYCGGTAPGHVLATSESMMTISDPVHGEGIHWESEFMTQVNVSVPPTLPDAPCGPLGTNPKIPPIRSRFMLRVFADGTKQSGFVSASLMPLHYLWEDGALKMHGGAPVHPAVDLVRWSESTGVPFRMTQIGLAALRRACCHGGRGLRGCVTTCRGGNSVVDAPPGVDPAPLYFACFGAAGSVAAQGCPSSCAAAGADCNIGTMAANP